MNAVYRYGGFYHDGEGWVAIIGDTEYARGELEKMDPALRPYVAKAPSRER